MLNRSGYFEQENKRLIIAPLQIIAALVVVAGTFALMFEVNYFAEFSFKVYFGRLLATLIGFVVLTATNFEIGRKNPTLLVHILLLTIITSFASIIYQIPQSLYVNSHLLALVIFTSALFLNWDMRNQVIVAIYYNIIFAASILFSDTSIYFLPSMFASVLFVMAISIMSIVASAMNYKLRQSALEKTFEVREIFENSSEGIFKIGLEGNILMVNPAFKSMLGFNTDNEVVERYNFRDLFNDSSDYDRLLSRLEHSDAVKNFTTTFVTSDNEEIIVSINIRAIFDFSVKLSNYEGSFQDVTEQKMIEEKINQYNLELQNLNNSKDKFFSIVAHDLISPFSALLGYSEILANEVEDLDPEQVKEFSRNIHSVAKKSHNLLSELLEWSRIQTGRIPFEPDVLPLAQLTEDIFTLYKNNAEKKQIKLINNIDKGIAVYADYNMIHATVRNLVSNAIKFTDISGEVTLNAEENSENVSIIVQDNGMGMNEEDLEKLFKIDVHHTQIGTGKEKGSGLGLILCKEFVEKNGGMISVSSKPGEGSKFIFTLPKAEESTNL